jgi:divalent metal cation (Fe/Co/Zn/Cd) transporter
MYELDLHLQIDPGATVREGHAIAESVKRNIFLRHPEVLNALIHVEPASETHLVGKGVSDVNPGRIADNMQG